MHIDRMDKSINTVEITDNPFDKKTAPESWAIWEKNSAGGSDYPFFKRVMKGKPLTANFPNERDMDVILMVREGFTQRSVAVFFGVTDGRIHQILKKWEHIIKAMDDEDKAEQEGVADGEV